MTPFEPDGVCAGIPYRVLSDNSIEAMMPGGLVKFKDLDQLLAALPPLPSVDATPAYDILGQTDGRSYLPARPVDYYSLLLDAIKRVQTNSSQLRALVYERVRFNFKRDILFGNPSMGLTDLMRRANDFELAVARIEATADLDEPAQARRQSRQYATADRYEEKEVDESDSRYAAKTPEAEPDVAYAELEEPIEAAPTPSTSLVQVLPPRRPPPLQDWLDPIQVRDFSYESAPEFRFYKRLEREKLAILAFCMVLIGAVVVLASVLWLPVKTSQPVVATAPPPVAVPAQPAAPPQAAAAPPVAAPPVAPPKLPYPLPNSFGVYALSDNKLTELQTLPISIPDPRVALSAEIKDPSTKIVSDTKPAFILYRREFRNNVPQKISLRVIARMVRETKIVDGKAEVTQLEGPWRIRDISRDLTVSPVPGEPEMLIARLEDGISLDPGRYALVLNRTGYDFTIDGPVQSKDFCLEGFETTNGSIYTPCRTP